MSIFTEISDQWQVADNAFAAQESAAYAANDDAAFDIASDQRKRNDQAYFLYLFTRFEEIVTETAKTIVKNRSSGVVWEDRRIWEAWKSIVIRDDRNMHLMSKVEVIIDKSKHEYETIKQYYGGRNNIGHGGVFEEQFFIPQVATFMDTLATSFPAV